tara:strand:- start:439 stop:918 length:480 start_codon:yes stop_codon:yes gene_type:complete
MHVLLLVGHYMAGKSGFLRHLSGHPYSETYMQTIGKDMLYVGDFVIHDMSSNPRYNPICEEYYPYANAALIFYEVGKEDTVQEWIDKFPNIPIIIVCNKIDTVETYAAPNFNYPTLCVSCKTGQHIDQILPLVKTLLPNTKTYMDLDHPWPWSQWCVVQ